MKRSKYVDSDSEGTEQRHSKRKKRVQNIRPGHEGAREGKWMKGDRVYSDTS